MWDYQFPTLLTGDLGNNALSYNLRRELLQHDPYLTIPSIKVGTIKDVELGDEVVFEEVENSTLVTCRGLKHFIILENTNKRIAIFDNHNHALYFWLLWYKEGLITKGVELLHIDEHSDLWENTHALNLKKAQRDIEYIWKFVNYYCHVGNYIKPALESGLIGKMVRIENEFQIDEYMNYKIKEEVILNIDLDIFSHEMNYIDEKKILTCIKNLLKQSNFVTIATSPYFIDQGIAREKLLKILQ